jgi:hypothetical protein
MRRAFFGAAFVIAGIAAFIEAASHQPRWICLQNGDICGVNIGLTGTEYELLRIGGWALIIIGVLLVISGLIRYWALQKRMA